MFDNEQDEDAFFKPRNEPKKRVTQKPLIREFNFPPANFFEIKFKEEKEIPEKLRELEYEENTHQKKMYKRRKRQAYYYYICRHCNSTMSMKFVDDAIKFVRMETLHRHSSEKDDARLLNKEVEEYIEKKLQTHTYDETRLLMKSHFNLDSGKTSYLWNRYMNNAKITSVETYLSQLQYTVLKHQGEEQEVPEVFMTVSPQMVRCYQRFGDVVCFDLTYNLLRDRSKTGKQWGLGVFTGMGCNMELVIFGYCLTCSESVETFMMIFENVFQLLSGGQRTKMPSVIITDEQKSINHAIAELKKAGKFDGQHLLDIFHVLRNARKKITKNTMHLYKAMVKARNSGEYDTLLQRIVDVEDNMEVLMEFDAMSGMYCFSQIPKVFMGFSSSSSRSELINELIKRVLTRQTNLLTLVRTVNRLFEKLNGKLSYTPTETQKFEVLFGDPLIKDVRDVLASKVFHQFIINYVKGLKMDSDQISEDSYLVHNLEQRFNVVKEDGRWVCCCGYQTKAGLPCEHQLRVMVKTNFPTYMDFIHRRWQIGIGLSELSPPANKESEGEANEPNERFKTETRGRPKNSRRNPHH